MKLINQEKKFGYKMESLGISAVGAGQNSAFPLVIQYCQQPGILAMKHGSR